MPDRRSGSAPDPGRCRWHWHAMADLSAVTLHGILALRSRVFVVEQQCVYLDPDAADLAADHLHADCDGAVVATLRVLGPGTRFVEPSIGRVCVEPAWRGVGLGLRLMREGLAGCAARFPGQPLRLSAQRYLEPFYVGLGFRADSAPYLEDGIPHVEMVRG